jgi:hypothetical protein
MATSQFIIYSSSDPGGPGPLTGQTGSLITVLDACLVNGYPGKAAAGWIKHFPNLSGSVGCYTNISGSGMDLLVNDAGWQVSAVGREAIVVGWEALTALTSSAGVVLPMSLTGSHGSGYGQFPLPVQMGPWGHMVWRKSATADTTPRNWLMFADGMTMYLLTYTGDGGAYAGAYHMNIFGDIFSLKGSADAYRCLINGQFNDNQGTWWTYAQWNDMWDCIYQGQNNSTQQAYPNTVTNNCPFMARGVGGAPGAVQICKHFDTSRAYQFVTSIYNGNLYYVNGWFYNGNLPTPNTADGALYMSPVLIGESSGILRGRMRGLYVLQHAAGNFTDGQIIQGTGDYAGKTFMVMRYFGPFNTPFCIEISPTLETN